MTKEQQQTIERLRNMGLGYRKIGIALGLPRDKVRNYCKVNGLDGYAKRASKPEKEFIDTQYNLSSKVLGNIIQIIGIKYNDAIKTRRQFLDVNLLKNRNAIGHGNQLSVNSEEDLSPLDFSQVVKLKNFVVLMLDYFAEVLLKYVEDEFYLVSKETERNIYEDAQEETLNIKLAQIESEN